LSPKQQEKAVFINSSKTKISLASSSIRKYSKDRCRVTLIQSNRECRRCYFKYEDSFRPRL